MQTASVVDAWKHGPNRAARPMHHAEDSLQKLQVPVAAYLCPNLGHGLDDMSIQLGMEFLAEMFEVDVLDAAGMKP